MLFHYVNRCAVDRLREAAPPRRYAALACFLWQSYRDAIDQAVDIFDKPITWVHTQAQHDLDAQMRTQRQTIRTSLVTLKSLGEVILDEAVADGELRARLFQRVPRDELAAQLAALDEWVTGRKSDLLYGVVRRHAYLRRFTPAFFQALDFIPEGEGRPPCLEALAGC